MGAGDAVVPAEAILVEEAPEVSEGKGDGGEKRCKNAPAAKASGSGFSVEADKLEPGETQAERSASVDERKILISGPEQR